MELLMKRMTREQFIQATRRLTMGESTLEIAEGVLVNGRAQADYARAKQDHVEAAQGTVVGGREKA